MSPRVSILLVTWNSREDLPECLRCLRANTDVPGARLVVVDNASTDGTREILREQAPDAELILLDENRGWVRSLNLGISRAPADYYFFLNPDAFVQPNWLRPLVDAAAASADVGFAASKFLYPNGTLHYAGACIGPSRGIRVIGHGESDRGQYDEPRIVPFAHGMCLMKHAVVEAVGPFDERYGLGYYEELDLQLRARRRGFVARYVPQSVIVHATSRSFDRVPAAKRELMARNWLRLIGTHWPLSWLLLRAPLELLRPLRDREAAAPTLRAWRECLALFGELRDRRRSLARDGALDYRALRATGSLRR